MTTICFLDFYDPSQTVLKGGEYVNWTELVAEM